MRTRLAGLAAGLALVLAGAATAADARPADVCLEVAPGSVAAEEWSAVAEAVADTVVGRSALFPEPRVSEAAARLDIDSGHFEREVGDGSCLQAGYQWSARFGREFIAAGADQLLEDAPKTPGFSSAGTIEWFPAELRLRTTLEFSGPLGIPSGRCWVDDALSVDTDAGRAVASGERDLDTSPLGNVVCDRFYGYLPDGGAGEQAITLLPSTVALPDGASLRFVAQDVSVSQDAIVVSGRLERG